MHFHPKSQTQTVWAESTLMRDWTSNGNHSNQPASALNIISANIIFPHNFCYIAMCMKHLNVLLGDSRDKLGQKRFFSLRPEQHLIPGDSRRKSTLSIKLIYSNLGSYAGWYKRRTYYKEVKAIQSNYNRWAMTSQILRLLLKSFKLCPVLYNMTQL